MFWKAILHWWNVCAEVLWTAGVKIFNLVCSSFATYSWFHIYTNYNFRGAVYTVEYGVIERNKRVASLYDSEIFPQIYLHFSKIVNGLTNFDELHQYCPIQERYFLTKFQVPKGHKGPYGTLFLTVIFTIH